MVEVNIMQQSKNWDMDMSLEEIFKYNPKCKVDRKYKAHKYDECYHGYCMYLKHPTNDDYTLMVGIHEYGFMYLGTGGVDKDYPLEDTVDVAKEMVLYRDWVFQKEYVCKSKLSSQGIDYDMI